jgi:hypothetical protein
MKSSSIRLIKDKSIKKKNYQNKYEYIFDKKTDLVPKKINKLICIVFSEDKGCYFILRKFDNKNDSFRFNKGLYIIDNEAIHITKNGNRCCFYLEGVSVPIKMSNIEKIKEDVDYIDLDGKKQTSTVMKIKGLKFDSKILDTFTDRKLAENFTKTDNKNFGLFCLIIGIISLVMIGVSYGLIYYFR